MSGGQGGFRGTKPVSILVGTAFVAAALVVSVLAPADVQQQQPFVSVIPALGTEVQTQKFSATVSELRLTNRVQTPEWVGATDGVWLVIDMEFARRLDTGGIDGSLRIGERDYVPSARPDTASINDGAIGDAGLPWTGSMLFELPESALSAPGADVATLQLSTGEVRLAGVLEYTFDFGGIDRTDSITILEPERVAP
jgi:hypothetical protein